MVSTSCGKISKYGKQNGLSTLLAILILFSGACSKQTSENVKILVAGDLMLDRGTRKVIYEHNPDHLFSDVKQLFVSSDVTIANLECVACDPNIKAISKKFTFRANPEWVCSLRTNGITHLTLANNHSFDFGQEGARQTISSLNYCGIVPIGYNQKNSEICLPTIIEKNDAKIAIFSNCLLEQDSTFTSHENISNLTKTISEFKKTHPEHIIFLILHWGVELEHLPTPEQVEQAHHLVEAGADAIIGHHPHVVQSIERFKGKYIFYSIGNFIFDNNRPPSNQGLFTVFSVSGTKLEAVEVIPINIINCKPWLMNKDESEAFMNEISTMSRNFNIKQSANGWKII